MMLIEFLFLTKAFSLRINLLVNLLRDSFGPMVENYGNVDDVQFVVLIEVEFSS